MNLTAADMLSEDLSKKLNREKKEVFHRTVSKTLILCKRARPDAQPVTAALCTQVKSLELNDWNKLVKSRKFPHGTIEDKLALSSGNLNTAEWFVDAAFMGHLDFEGHGSDTCRFLGRKGTPIQGLMKQKFNIVSSVTCELVSADQPLPLVVWTPLFLEAQ